MIKEITITQISNGFILMFEDRGDFENKTEVYESFIAVSERLRDFFHYRQTGLTRRDANEKNDKELTEELQLLNAVVTSALKNVLFSITELSRDEVNSDEFYRNIELGLTGLRQARASAFGSSAYNKAIDNTLALIEGLRKDYKNDSYR